MEQAQVSLLTKIGMARAIRDTARLAQGIEDPDQAIRWAVSIGYIVMGPERGEITFTERGMALAYAYWKAIDESQQILDGRTGTIETLNRHMRPTILLPDGARITLDRHPVEAGGANPAVYVKAIEADQRSRGDTTAKASSDTIGENVTLSGEDHTSEAA